MQHTQKHTAVGRNACAAVAFLTFTPPHVNSCNTLSCTGVYGTLYDEWVNGDISPFRTLLSSCATVEMTTGAVMSSETNEVSAAETSPIVVRYGRNDYRTLPKGGVLFYG